MSAERTLSAARQAQKSRVRLYTLAVSAALAIATVACRQAASHLVLSETAPDAGRVALVRLIPCGSGWCESLWIGTNLDSATRLATLPQGEERCDDIAWTRDSKRVGFLVNGYQLRLYDAQSHAPAGLADLVPADARPTTRIARGITFSDNGAAVTFDDCPRERSGCKPGMLGLR
jgi:hypothetical protein